jgi:ATP-dependent DNA helicase RecG
MPTSAERRQAALEAIDAVMAGVSARDRESEHVDFKEESGTVDRSGRRGKVSDRHEPAAVALAAEAACMANTAQGGILVVGVDDKASGVSSLVGAYSDADWLRRRIWALTQPNLTVDVEEVQRAGVRLLLVNVPDALEEVRSNGKLRTRVGTDCEELTGDRARQFLEARRGFDWSAQRSGMHLSMATSEAWASARRHYEEENGTAPGSNHEIARRLGVLLGDDEDPELSRAGALLLCAYEPNAPQIHLMLSDTEGIASRRSVRAGAPILPLYDAVLSMLLSEAFPAESRLVGTQRQSLRAIPEVAIRESIVNAIMHRDYRLDRATIIALATGVPGDVFKVRSPGGLPPGVSAARLIATQSKPRNPALAEAMRVLGLAEKEGVGIDTMYRLMLRDGHPEPEIAEQDGEVVVRLSGGVPDVLLREFFDGLAAREPRLRDEVRATIAITRLFSRPVLRPELLAEVAQSSVGDATHTLDRLAEVGAVERLLDGSRSYRLSREARDVLGDRVRYARRSAIERHTELVDAYLDTHADIGREEAVMLLGVGETRASQILGELAQAHRITRIGPRRGRLVRYRMA